MCGTSRWKTAKSSSKIMRNLDETGLVVAGCRHTIAQTALNMFRGEMYIMNLILCIHRYSTYIIHVDLATHTTYISMISQPRISSFFGKM